MITQTDQPEYEMSITDELKTVRGIVCWLEAIAHDGDCNIDRDKISETCEVAAKRLKSMQHSLIEEVARIEKLQPFFADICAVVEHAKAKS